MTRPFLSPALWVAAILFSNSPSAHSAGSTWIGASGGQWNNTANWSTGVVPSHDDDFAIFNSGGGANVLVNFGPNLLKLQFDPGTPSYHFQIDGAMKLRGVGVENLSGSVQNFTVPGRLFLNNSSTTANSAISVTGGGTVQYFDASSAGNSTIEVAGTSTSNIGLLEFDNTATAGGSTLSANPWGFINFLGYSSAGSSQISVTANTNFNSKVAFYAHAKAGSSTITGSASSTIYFEGLADAESTTITTSGGVHFQGQSTAGSSTISINSHGQSAFWDFTSAGTAHITLNGSLVFNDYSTAEHAQIDLNNGSELTFQDDTTGGESTISALSGSAVTFLHNSSAGNATIDVAVGAQLTFENGSAGSATISSQEIVRFLGDANDTIFSGSYSGAGGLNKSGANKLEITGANSFTGGAFLMGGTLLTSNALALSGGRVALGGNATLDIYTGTNLEVSDLTWADGGTVGLTLGSNSAFVSNGTLSQSGTANFLFRDGGFATNTTYEVITFQNLGATYNTWAANAIGGIEGAFELRDNGDGTSTLLVTYAGTASGSEIDNNAPAYTPLNTEFLVVGEVTAAAGPQEVGFLTFTNGGTVSITDSLLLNQGLVNVNSGTGSISNGVLLTPGDLTKTGDGLLNIDSTVVTGGNTNISQGALAVNGTLVTDNVLVQQGATLKGSGSIIGDVANSGTVAPGNSPGTLTIMGNFAQNSSGTLAIEVGDGTSDLLVVTGTATLAGTLQAAEYGGHEFAYGDQVTFLQAGNIVGEFDQIVTPNDFRGRVFLNNGTGTLLLAPESYTLVAVGQNQTNVARALDGFIGASGDRDAVSLALDLQTESEYGNAFDQISPAFFQTLTDTVIEQTNAQNQMLAQRLSAVRLGSKGFNLIGLDQAALTVDRNGKNVMDAKDEKDIINPGTDTDWSVFVQGNGIFSRVTNVSQVPNYNYNSGGFIVGIDYTFGEKATTSTVRDGKAVVTKATPQGSTLTVGLYTGYQGTYAKYANGGDMTLNSALFGGYASYTNGGFYSDAIVGGAYNGYRVNRSINFSTVDRTARSSPDGGTFTTYLDAGYDWKVGGFTFGPVLSGQYTYAGTAGFTENGAESLDLAVGQQNANSIRTNVGGRVAFTWNVTKSITIIPEGRMFWQHEYLNGPRTVGASLDGGNGPGFDYVTAAPGQDSVFTGAGVSANFGERWNTGFYYNADFGRQDFVSHMISANLSWKF